MNLNRFTIAFESLLLVVMINAGCSQKQPEAKSSTVNIPSVDTIHYNPSTEKDSIIEIPESTYVDQSSPITLSGEAFLYRTDSNQFSLVLDPGTEYEWTLNHITRIVSTRYNHVVLFYDSISHGNKIGVISHMWDEWRGKYSHVYYPNEFFKYRITEIFRGNDLILVRDSMIDTEQFWKMKHQ